MNSGLQAVAVFGHSLPGLVLLSLGQSLVVACVCADLVRAVSVPRSRGRYLANTAFRTLALPSIGIMAVVVLVHAASGAWEQVAGGVFVLVSVIFRWHHCPDEDSWWTGKGTALRRWARRKLAAAGPLVAPAAA
ncbi:hypothetical protein [Arthrobacter sp. Soil763]|uniref:hypothetical protein n=1 Tax=Arthrobacter sp. Soil763 TaxID=1736402 RepID=UPI000AC999CD|nr:hypothetical protein [Arthrobacter sp. Soil763]